MSETKEYVHENVKIEIKASYNDGQPNKGGYYKYQALLYPNSDKGDIKERSISSLMPLEVGETYIAGKLVVKDSGTPNPKNPPHNYWNRNVEDCRKADGSAPAPRKSAPSSNPSVAIMKALETINNKVDRVIELLDVPVIKDPSDIGAGSDDDLPEDFPF